jgi:ABC-type uncharacterized transport system permease subunit
MSGRVRASRIFGKFFVCVVVGFLTIIFIDSLIPSESLLSGVFGIFVGVVIFETAIFWSARERHLK